MLSLNNVTMRYGARVLFEEVTSSFLEGRRYAITGPNGAGKTTLMKILEGDVEPTKGSVSRPKKLGILRQDQFAFDEFRVIDTVIMGNGGLWKALQERDLLYAKPHEELTDKDGMRLGELEGIVGDEGGYTAEADAAILLDGLGVESTLHERKMGELQGGQKVRVLLAQALFGNPAALLLDEPTNHLDLDSVHWLQEYLLEYPPFSEQRVHAHRRHRLPDCDHVHGRLRRNGPGQDADSLAHRGRKCRARKENRAAQRIHRPVLRRHALLASDVA
jgi:ATPase subunit of ABC transporter with duplicated ATPase domains